LQIFFGIFVAIVIIMAVALPLIKGHAEVNATIGFSLLDYLVHFVAVGILTLAIGFTMRRYDKKC